MIIFSKLVWSLPYFQIAKVLRAITTVVLVFVVITIIIISIIIILMSCVIPFPVVHGDQ